MNCYAKNKKQNPVRIHTQKQPQITHEGYAQPIDSYSDEAYEEAYRAAGYTEEPNSLVPTVDEPLWTRGQNVQPAPWPEYDPVNQQDYTLMPGYLRANIGNPMRVEFCCGAMSGCDQMTEKSGVLLEVGTDYIVLGSQEGGKICCDMNSVRFVNIVPATPRGQFSAPQQENFMMP